jgi:uncharacterized protein (DUF433 family)
MLVPDFLTRAADGEIRLAGHRIGLFHVLHYYHEGYAPEMLACQYPTLSLALIYKVLAWYLENQAEVDAYLAECRAEADRQRASNPRRVDMAALRRRLAGRRQTEGGAPAESA